MQKENWTAWKLARWIVEQLRFHFLVYLGAAALFALVTLAPGKLLHYFAVELPAIHTAAQQKSFLELLFFFGALIAVGCAIGAVVKVYFKEKLRLELEAFLRFEVVQRLHAMPVTQLRGLQRGEWLTKVGADIKMTEDFLGVTVPDILYNLILAIGTCAFLAYYSREVALVLLAGAIISASLYYLIQKRLNPVLGEMRSLHSTVFQLLLENLEGWRTIRSFDVVPSELRRVNSKLDLIRKKGLVVARLIGTLLSTNELVTQSLIVVCLFSAAWGAFTGRISAADALVYPFFLGQFFFAVRGLIRGLSGVNHYYAHGARLAALFQDRVAQKAHILALPEQRCAMTVSELSLKIGRSQLLSNLTFSVQTGQINALTGLSGSGKSTILDVLAGLHPFDGSISIRSLESSWEVARSGTDQMLPTSACSYVEQNPYLFEATLRENLLVGRKGICDFELWRAIEAVGLSELFQSRQGLDSVISDQGNNLSEGQVYRVGVARAIVECRTFLLLDEPFASLDEESVRTLTTALRQLSSTCGILVVTHQIPDGLQFDNTFTVAPLEASSEINNRFAKTLNSPRKNDRLFSGLYIQPVTTKEKQHVQ